MSEYCFIIFSCYLPPEGSVRADSYGLYNHLLVQIYNLLEADAIYVCGDLNSRIGQLEDCISDTDMDVPPRVSLDNVVNKHGAMLVEFLKDSKCCVLNGRISGNDNFTSISVKGKAVVDYIITPHNCLNTCIELNIHSPNELIESGTFSCLNLLGDRYRVPDHSMLVLTFQAGGGSTEDYRVSDNVQLRQYPQKNIRNVSPHLFSSSECQIVLIELLDKLTQVQHQKEIDKWYGEFCKYICNVTEVSSSPYSNRKDGFSRKRKPYWNGQLKVMWKEMRMAERRFLKCDGKDLRKQQLKNEFKARQNNFDRKLRACKINYERGQALKIEHLQTNNPQLFWNMINNLGPKRVKSIPMELVLENGSSVFAIDCILKKWETDFGSLFSGSNCPAEWNNCFLARIVDLKNIMEANMQQDSYSFNQYLNASITEEEVKRAIGGLKLRKATGIDNLANELLKLPFI